MFDLRYQFQAPTHMLGVPLSNPVALALIKVLLVVPVLFQLVPIMIWWERRLLSWMQDRIGPNRTGTFTLGSSFPIKALRGKRIGTFGLFQLLADGVKGFTKEQVHPGDIDKLVYLLGPVMVVFPAFIITATTPWGPQTGIYGLLTPIANVDFGLLYVLAVSSLSAYGVVLGGYSSNNKYSLMGGLRASAQLLSYELAMGMAAATAVLAAGSMKLPEIVKAQEGPLWGFVSGVQNWYIFTPFGFVAAVIFLICMVAETNRAPFDLPEAENELIAGYMTEYSSKGFLLYAMGEYIAMFSFGAIFSTLFLGGYNLTPIRWDAMAGQPGAWGAFSTFMQSVSYWLAPLGLLAKGAAGITLFIWIRATLPRLRYDQLMKLGWQTLLPMGVANIIVVAVWLIATDMLGPIGGWASLIGASVIVFILWMNFTAAAKSSVSVEERRKVAMVEPTSERRGITLVDPKGGA